MLIVGAKEEEQKMVSVRKRDAEEKKQDLGMMSLEEFCAALEKEGLSHPAARPAEK